MTRELSSEVKNAISAQNSETIYFFKINFYNSAVKAEEPMYLSTGSNDMDWNGATWVAIGGNLHFNTIQESTDLSNNGTEINLPGVNRTLIALVQGKLFIGREIQIYLVKISAVTRKIIVDPKLIFQGNMNGGFEIKDTPPTGNEIGKTDISCRAISEISDFDRVNGMQSNVVSHQRWYYGDTFFRHVEATMDAKINWASD